MLMPAPILNLEGLTLIVVTHTLDEALLRSYDSILVLENGSIVENGKFMQIVGLNGHLCHIRRTV